MHGGRTGDGSDGVTVVLVLALVLGMIAAAAGATEEVLLNLAASGSRATDFKGSETPKPPATPPG